LQLDYDEEVHFRTLEKLRDLRRSSDDGQPFFLWTSYTHPHDPFIITREYWDIYDHGEIDLPRVPAAPIEEMHPFNQWVQIHHEVDRYPPSEEVIRTTRHAFYGMITYFDRKVCEIIDELDRLSLTEDTVIMVLSDHGEMMGEHGMWFKRTFFDGATRVPLIMSWPGRWLEGRREPRTVSLVDIFPTLLELAGGTGIPACDCSGLQQVQSSLDGHSFLPLLSDPEADWKDEAICEYYGEGVIHAMRMLRRGPYKYVHVEDNSPLLFDMEADPDETRNLAEDPAYAQIAQEMRDRLLAGWNGQAMERAVMENQQTRLIIRDAMAKGRLTSWDYQPVFDGSKQYVREKDSQETNMLMRIPRHKEK
jgi:choline-sulfatase